MLKCFRKYSEKYGFPEQFFAQLVSGRVIFFVVVRFDLI